MSRRLKAEMWDKMHYLFRNYNDRMIRIRLKYDFILDENAVKAVIESFLEAAPVFHSHFQKNIIRPYWVVHPYDINDIVSTQNVSEVNVKAATEEFMVSHLIPEESPCQMKVRLFFHDGKTTLVFLYSHMCMDGGDTRYFIEDFCKGYSGYMETGKVNINWHTGSRSYKTVYKSMSDEDAGIAKHLYKNISKKDDHSFPLTGKGSDDRPFMVERKISAERITALKAAGRLRGATLNDIFLAAYFQSIYELAKFGKDESLSVSCAVDLRRHIKDMSGVGYTNHTAWIQCSVPRCGKDIFETLGYTMEASHKFKEDRFIGLHGLPLLSFAYWFFPHFISEFAIKLGYSNPRIAMSNIGVFSPQKFSILGREPYDFFASGSVKYKPFVLMSDYTFNGATTFAMFEKGSDRDKEIIEHFFDIMEKNFNLLSQSSEDKSMD